jgi:hypothetical protein
MKSIACSLLLLGGIIIIVLSSIFIMSPSPLLPNQSSAFATFPGENGKIAFASNRDDGGSEFEIYVMNADGTGQTNTSNDHRGSNDFPDWGPATSSSPPPPPPEEEEDTTPPILTVPKNRVVEATSPDGAQVTYTVTAQDDVDGTVTLEEDDDGSTVTQDNVGGNITISCDPPSGSTFPVGDTEVECSATDAAGNTGIASFIVTANNTPPRPPPSAFDILETL